MDLKLRLFCQTTISKLKKELEAQQLLWLVRFWRELSKSEQLTPVGQGYLGLGSESEKIGFSVKHTDVKLMKEDAKYCIY